MRCTVALSCFVASGAPALAHGAETDGIALTWSAPASCPSVADVRAKLVSRVGPDAKVRVDGRVERFAKHFRLKLDVETAKSRGERNLEADTCEALASSAAVVVAMSVSADRAEEQADPAAAPPSPEPRPEVAAPHSAPREKASPAPVPRDRVTLRVEAAGDAGFLPSAGLGGGGAVGFSPIAHLRFELAGDAWLAQDGHAAANSTRGAAFHLLSGAARACWTLTRRFDVAPCLGADVLHLGAEGFGAAKDYASDAVIVGPEAGLTAVIPVIGAFGVRIGAAALVPVARPAFVITSDGTVLRPSAVAFRGYVGPEVHF